MAMIGSLLLGGAASCTRAPAAPAAPQKPLKPLHEGPLTDYVPAAALRWMLIGKPRSLLANPAIAPATKLLIPQTRWEAFELASGVDLRQVRDALVAGFDFGTLYAFQPVAGTAPQAVKRFRDRIVSRERIYRPDPRIDRITGIIGTTPETLVRIDQSLVAVAVGDPMPARVVEAFALGRLSRSPNALRGAALSTLGEPPKGALATFYAPGPFPQEWARGASGLLAQAFAARISMAPLDAERAHFELELTGEFPPDGAERLRVAYAALVQSALGKLVGLDQPAAEPLVLERGDHLQLEVDLEIMPIARGLRAAVISDVWEILNLSAPNRAKD
ncbi:MAG TPA: hypothetical protein VFQ61_29525 [Polyangiaceae bacterium]|nr:hypothetical protein [Polyangiaceae bacterium]